jgi:hypothetical protein
MNLKTAVDRSFTFATPHGHSVFAFDDVHLLGDIAMHPPVPRSPRHTALLLLAGISPPRRRVLSGTPIAVLVGASNCRF